jgi:hypothetical protein
MPAKRRSMADLLAEQRAIEDTPAAEAPALEVVPEPVQPVAVPIPEPRAPASDGQLSPGEESGLAACEAAIDNLRLAFAAAGKALQVIRDGRLYRGTHATFEEYGLERWDMSRPQLYRLIEAWPLGERLAKIGAKANERQVRELLPVEERHGQDAAVTVYQAVTEADDVRMTAAVLKDVVGQLPADHFDQAEAVSQIRAYLAGGKEPGPDSRTDPAQAFAAESGRLVKKLHRFARAAGPDAVRQAVAGIRSALDEIESDLP